jgi:protein TonB
LPPPAQASLPTPSFDFSKSLPKPKSKKWLRAQGNLTPGSRLRLILLSTALVITATGALWYTHWIPWRSSVKKASVPVSAGPANAKTSTPPSSPEAAAARSDSSSTPSPSQGEASSNSPGPESAATAVDSVAQPSASGESVALPLSRKTLVSPTLASKRSSSVPAAKPASDALAPSAADGSIVPPKLIKSVQAVASIEALRDFERGNVVIDAVVGASGEITSMNVLSGPPSLRDLALDYLKQYRYEPATRNGQPVPAHVTVTIRFRFEP